MTTQSYKVRTQTFCLLLSVHIHPSLCLTDSEIVEKYKLASKDMPDTLTGSACA